MLPSNKFMKSLAFFLILFSPLVQAEKISPEAKAWKRAGFLNAEISSIPVPEPPSTDATSNIPVTHALDATIVMFRNTGWTKVIIESHLKRTNEIYAHCGIRLGEIRFVESDAYQNRLDINRRWMSESDDYFISKATPIEKRPVIYLMRDLMPKQMREGAFTNLENFEWAPLDPVTRNTIWISSFINDPRYPTYRDIDSEGRTSVKFRDPSYNVLAHEIAHLLADMGHETEIKEKNLLNGSDSELNDHLLPRQCEKFKQSPLLRNL